MLISSLMCDVISFFILRINVKISKTNSSYILNDLKNFNEIFRKGLIYDNIIKVTKNQGFTVSEKLPLSLLRVNSAPK